MAPMVAFSLYLFEPLESAADEAVAPYLALLLIGIVVVAVGFFNDHFKAKVTMPIGIAGWLAVLVMEYLFYSRQR